MWSQEKPIYLSGIKGRDDKSRGVEIRMSDAFAKINPTDPLILTKQAARRNLNCSECRRSPCEHKPCLLLIDKTRAKYKTYI